MANLMAFRSQLLSDGRITPSEVDLIVDQIAADGKLDIEDMKLLVELMVDADEVCPEFDELFFPALREIILQDGKVGFDEHFYLLKMLYSDGIIRPRERSFLMELRSEAEEFAPEFIELCDTALNAPSQGWSVEGRRS